MQSAQFALHAQIEQSHWWFVARRAIMRGLIGEVLPPDPKTLIVDVGCGAGANLAALADDYRCLGIDASVEAVDLARRRFPQVRFITGLAPDDLEEAASQARLFLLMDVLEHVADDFELLSRLLAAASPGAYFLITVPADWALWSPHDEAFGHYRRYTMQRFSETWAGLPVETCLLSYFNSRLYPLVRWIRERNRRRGAAAGAAGTDFEIPRWPLNGLLQRCFAGEERALRRQLRRHEHGDDVPAYQRGVSLIALLRRREGPLFPRRKPAHLAADDFDPHPAAGQFCESDETSLSAAILSNRRQENCPMQLVVAEDDATMSYAMRPSFERDFAPRPELSLFVGE